MNQQAHEIEVDQQEHEAGGIGANKSQENGLWSCGEWRGPET